MAHVHRKALYSSVNSVLFCLCSQNSVVHFCVQCTAVLMFIEQYCAVLCTDVLSSECIPVFSAVQASASYSLPSVQLSDVQ